MGSDRPGSAGGQAASRRAQPYAHPVVGRFEFEGNRPYGYNGRKRFERLLAEGRAEWEPALPLDAAETVCSADTGFEDMVLTGVDYGLAYMF